MEMTKPRCSWVSAEGQLEIAAAEKRGGMVDGDRLAIADRFGCRSEATREIAEEDDGSKLEYACDAHVGYLLGERCCVVHPVWSAIEALTNQVHDLTGPTRHPDETCDQFRQRATAAYMTPEQPTPTPFVSITVTPQTVGIAPRIQQPPYILTPESQAEYLARCLETSTAADRDAHILPPIRVTPVPIDVMVESPNRFGVAIQPGRLYSDADSLESFGTTAFGIDTMRDSISLDLYASRIECRAWECDLPQRYVGPIRDIAQRVIAELQYEPLPTNAQGLERFVLAFHRAIWARSP
jgi:hypothetical protein